MNPSNFPPWTSNWAWAVPLILMCVIFHAGGLALINDRVVHRLSGGAGRLGFVPGIAIGMSVITFLVTFLHAIEALIWMAAYRFLGALPDTKSAMLFSLGSMTTNGCADVLVKPEWYLMGELEALNGVLLFGLTTAFLFAVFNALAT